MLTAEPQGYSSAIELIKVLAGYGIESNITTGGVSIYPTTDTEIQTVKQVCSEMGVYVSNDKHSLMASMHMESIDHKNKGLQYP